MPPLEWSAKMHSGGGELAFSLSNCTFIRDTRWNTFSLSWAIGQNMRTG